MRVAVASLALLVSVAVACAQGATTPPRTQLTITVWPAGEGAASKSWTLRCGPVGGTLPRRAAACTALARLDSPFRPVPEGSVCTQIYGGPEEALVRGRHRGRSVYARFNRGDGCNIARWNRVAFLFPIRLS